MTIGPEPPSIPGYKVGAYLGRGAMGTLWEAEDRAGRRVALKVADRGTRVGPERMSRAHRREAAAALAVGHPNLVQGLAVGVTSAGRPFVALEYLDGETLGDRLRREGALPESETVRVGLAVAAGLEHLHAHDLVHRDVKPDNVMLLHDGTVKLLDLGLVDESELDAPGCGSPGYASPEMMTGRRVGAPSDLWALGVTLACCVLGHVPFQGATVQEVLRSAYRDPFVLPPQVAGRDLSEGFRRVVQRLLEKAPADRYASAAQVRLDLEALRDGDKPLGALWAVRARPRLGRKAWIAGVVALVAGVAVLASVSSKQSEVAAPSSASGALGAPAAPSPEAPDDPRAEAALRLAARRDVEPAEARAALLGVGDRPMSRSQRERYEAALAVAEPVADGAAGEELRSRCRMAARRRAVGDLEGMRTLLEDWPEALRATPAAAEARRLAELWSEESRRPAQALLADVDQAEGSTERVPLEELDALLGRVRSAREDPSTPQDARVALNAAEGRVEALRAGASAETREAQAWAELAQAWAGGPEVREARLRGFVTARAGLGTRAVSTAATVLANAQAARSALERILAGTRGQPCALWLEGGFGVGVAPRAATRELFAPGHRVWDASAPGAAYLGELESWLEDPVVLEAWLLVQGLPGLETIRGGSPAAYALRAIAPVVVTEPEASLAPVEPTWRELHELWPFAARAPGAPAALRSEVPTGPLATAWRAALEAPAARRSAATVPAPELALARQRFLADDWIACWVELERVVATLPGDGEAALLRSLVVSRTAETLPTLGARLFAFVEARRAWDLDPQLGRAPRQAAESGVALHHVAPLDLRLALGPTVAACCEAVLTLRHESASTLAFLAHHYLDTDRMALALRTARRAAAAWPEDPEALLALARAEQLLGDPRRAREALEAARQRAGGELPAWARGWFR